jgi:HEAT repeat protein
MVFAKKTGDEASVAMRAKGLGRLRKAFEACRSARIKSGLAIAMGVARDPEAGPLLFKAMKESDVEDLSGHIAVALGMVNHAAAADYLREVLQDRERSPWLKKQVAIALGCIGDSDMMQPLAEIMDDTTVRPITRALVTLALGKIGDDRALPALFVGCNYVASTPRLLRVLCIMNS